MRNKLKNIKRVVLSTVDYNPRKFAYKIKALAVWNEDFKELKKQGLGDDNFNLDTLYPFLEDKKDSSGTATGHYFHQDLYVARLIYENCPQQHIDIGSRIDGFVAHVAVFREIEVIDIRPIENKVKNIKFKQMDFMLLPKTMYKAYQSISSLHAIEHFGLGRYGDPINFYGHIKAIDNIALMLKEGGVFYFSVPIGPQRIEFNAHRIFSLGYIINILKKNFEIENFSYVDDQGGFFEDCMLTKDKIVNNFGCNHGCGIFTCIKK